MEFIQHDKGGKNIKFVSCQLNNQPQEELYTITLLRTPCFSSRSCEVQAVFANNSVNSVQTFASIKSKTFFDAICLVDNYAQSCDHENQRG